MHNHIQTNIIKTICYFDIFDYPLTSFEIWQKIDLKIDLPEIINELENINKNIIKEKHGFYFLDKREEIINIRRKRYNHTIRKLKRAKLITHIFKFIPSIKFIAVGNLVGAHNLKNKSDIDFFIITKPGTIWTTRFITTGLMKILGLRPQQNNQTDKICLSFFITSQSLNFDQFKINAKDTYIKYWLADLYPIYETNNTYSNLINENTWLKKELPNWLRVIPNSKYSLEEKNKKIQFNFTRITNLIEKTLKNFQLKILPKNIKESMNQNTNIVVTDDILKFHTNDRREKYNNLFIKKYKEINKAALLSRQKNNIGKN